MVCRFCGVERALIKAHIVPEAFFRALHDGSGVPQLHTNTPGAYPKRAPVGVYDKSILCRECDNRFSPWDNHAQQVLLRDFAETLAIFHEGTKIGWRIDRFDYRLFRLFFISLLWRASISTHQYYRRVSVGPFENKLRQMITDREPGAAETFGINLAKFDAPGYTGMLDPHPTRYHGINYCRIYLAGFVAEIKVDHQPPPEPLASLLVREGQPIIVVRRSPGASTDAAVMRDIARSAWRLTHGR
jgi:hypothetical protein